MKGRALLLGLSLVLAATLLTRGAGPRAAPPSPAPAASARPAAEAPPAPTPQGLARDPFRYFEDALSPAPADAASNPAAGAPEEPRAPDPAPLRLVGLVWRGERLLAALAIDGIVLTARAGETVAGYRVLSVDEDSGVRLQDPAGEEVLLAPPPSSSPLLEAR